MKRIVALIVFALSALMPVFAEVSVTNVIVTRMDLPFGTNNFTVPSGKIFYIEQVIVGSTNARVSFYQTVNISSFVEVVFARDQLVTSFSPSLKLTSGHLIFVSTGTAVLTGLLVDPADVYAAIPATISPMSVASGGAIAGSVQLDSPRPALVELQTSESLGSWQDAPDIAFARGTATANYDFLTSRLEDRLFLRATARARTPR